MPAAPGQDALYIAARAPRPGFAKTRLGRQIGHAAATTLYRAFLRDLSAGLAGLPASCGCTVGWYVTPPEAWGEIAPWLVRDARRPARVLAQGEGDWTARQHALFAGAAARGEGRTILVASDSPQITVELVVDAFRQLERHDVVLGPVHDGGYYLIGMRGWHDLLRGIPMSTGTVLREISGRARALGLAVGQVAPLFDIDEVEDLARLRALVAMRPDLVATRTALRDLGLLDGPGTVGWGPPGDAASRPPELSVLTGD